MVSQHLNNKDIQYFVIKLSTPTCDHSYLHPNVSMLNCSFLDPILAMIAAYQQLHDEKVPSTKLLMKLHMCFNSTTNK